MRGHLGTCCRGNERDVTVNNRRGVASMTLTPQAHTNTHARNDNDTVT
jgi:hypothetical protein